MSDIKYFEDLYWICKPNKKYFLWTTFCYDMNDINIHFC